MNTLVKRSDFYPFNSFFNDFWTRDLFDGELRNNTLPQVNIVETNDDFQVEMAVSGMHKKDFRAELDNDSLTIWAEVENDHKDEHRNYNRREFSYHSFKRSFYLPNTVDSEHIKATYQDGILRLVIPKKEEAKRKPVKTIAIT